MKKISFGRRAYVPGAVAVGFAFRLGNSKSVSNTERETERGERERGASMPASAAWARPEDLVESLSSLDNTARLKALRDVKNQIIGNKTKKLSYIKLGAVPRVVEILASDTEIPLLVQSAAAVGSFACGIDAGVKAVLDSGVLPHLLKMLQNGDNKVNASLIPVFLPVFFLNSSAPEHTSLGASAVTVVVVDAASYYQFRVSVF